MRAPTLKACWFIGMFAGLGGVYGGACNADNPDLNLEGVRAPSGSAASTGGGNTGGGTPVTGSTSTSTSTSASISTSTSTSTSGGGGTTESCPNNPGCKPPDAICGAGMCTNGACVFTERTLASDVYGDCHRTVCDAQGKVARVVDDSAPNVYDDGNPCTKDACANGVPSHQVVSGSMCPLATGMMGVCDSNGLCVECLMDGQCKDSKLSVCKTYHTTDNITGKCVAPSCSNGMKDGKETGADCGGPDCGPCPDQGDCDVDTDCQNLKCGGIFSKSCSLPRCDDSVKNDKETDTDCGLVCSSAGKLCSDGRRCALPTDCKSGVCKVGICQPPSCIDGVKNGSETDIDCGGGCDPALCFKHP